MESCGFLAFRSIQFIHTVICLSHLSFPLVLSILLHKYTTISYFSVDEHLVGISRVLAIMNKAAVNILIQLFDVNTCTDFSLTYI